MISKNITKGFIRIGSDNNKLVKAINRIQAKTSNYTSEGSALIATIKQIIK